MDDKDTDCVVIVTRSEKETRELGNTLASFLCPGDVVLLIGELGAGKTCLAKGIAQGLSVEENVLSPTFTLLKEYKGVSPLYHLDAYRLEGPWDLFDIGLEEYLEGDGILLVEWGDRVRGFFAQTYLEMRMEFTVHEEERRITILPRGETWRNRLRDLLDGGGVFDRR
jgi:tRNA threonylcarbamoyladenosine biosynthesis protein TsaE